MLATLAFITMHKVNTKLKAFDNNQDLQIWLKTQYYLRIQNNVSIIVWAIAQI
jgi:hypothetical protein